MATLKDKAQEILDEKNNKLTPNILPNYVNLFGVQGSVQTLDAYTTGSSVDMNRTQYMDWGNGYSTLEVTFSEDVLQRQNSGVSVPILNPAMTTNIASQMNIRPEIIKNGETILNVTGTYEGSGGGGSGDVKLFETVEQMQQDPEAREGDLAIVYRNEINNMQEDSVFSSITCPNIVILPKKIDDWVWARFRSVDETQFIDMNCELGPDMFRLDGWREQGEVRIQYESQDGITYTRIDGGDKTIDLGMEVQREPNENWDKVLGYFMQVGGNHFEGLYENRAVLVKDKRRILQLSDCKIDYINDTYSYNETSQEDNIYLDINDVKFVSRWFANRYPNMTSGGANFIGYFYYNGNLDKWYVLNTDSHSYLSGIMEYNNKYVPCCSISNGDINNEEVGLFEVDFHNMTCTKVADLSNVADFQCAWADIEVTASGITVIDYKFSSGEYDLNYLEENQAIGIYKYMQGSGIPEQVGIINISIISYITYMYLIAQTQLDATADFVYGKSFYGKNGIDVGELNKTTDLSKDEILKRTYIFNELNYLQPSSTNLSSMFADCKNINCVPNMNTINATNMYQMFIGCTNLETIPNINTSNANDMSYMFCACSNLNSIPQLDVHNVINAGHMFAGCGNLKAVPNLNLINVKDVSSMFESCYNLVDISQLNIQSATNLSAVFWNCTNLINVSEFDLSNARNISNMFLDCSNITSVDLRNTGSINSFYRVFYGCHNLIDINNLDTSSAVSMESMFGDCVSITNAFSLNTTMVNNMIGMFQRCISLVNVPNYSTSNVTSMSGMFSDCANLTTIPNFDTTNVTSMSGMFSGCTNISSIPNFNTTNVTYMDDMFRECTNLTTIPDFDTTNVTSMWLMFYGCTNLTSVPLLDTSNITSTESMFSECSSLLTVPNFNTSKVTQMNGMFYRCTNLVEVPHFDTSNVTDMHYMFENCSSLLNIPALDISKVTQLYETFKGCTNLVDVPLLNTSNVYRMQYVFEGCTNLSNESLNNILAMCANSAVTSSKTLLICMGLTQEQANRCQTLSNYQAFLDAGWTTGY